MTRLASLSHLLPRWFRPQPLGRRGEAYAARFLKRQGYQIVARSDRGRCGELDLVAVDKSTVVFVEVKTRRSSSRGTPAEAVDLEKQRRLTRAALAFLKRHDLLEYAARFDVVALVWPPAQRRPEVQHLQNAFPPVGKWQMFC